MGCREGCLLLVLVISCISARSLAAIDVSAAGEVVQSSSEATEPNPVQEVVCAICEHYASDIMNFFGENKTRTGIINIFHKSCSVMPFLYRHSCISLVDFFLSLLFEKIDAVKPEMLCESVNICGKNATAPSIFSDVAACSVCQNSASPMVVQLRDHDTKLQLMEALLIGCDTMVKFGQETKNVVMEYAPLVISNAQNFIEKTHLCTHVCKAPQQLMAGPSPAAI